MVDENKPDSKGPVVIRKGQVTPLRDAPAAPEPPAAKPAADARPLWQRVADQQRAGAPSAGGAPPGPRGQRPGGFRGPGGPGGRPGPAGSGRDRPRSGGPDRPRHGREEREPRAAGPAAPPLPAGEPPPAPEAQVNDEGSFADMFAGAEASPRRRFAIGEKVAGKIIQLGHDVAFLELGSGVAEGMIDVTELQDDDGNVAAREGDIIDGVVVKATDRGVIVSKGRAKVKGDQGRDALVEAARNGLPVEGVVKAANKGGLEVEVHGQRAFCPMSQIDVRFVGDAAQFVGQKLVFKVQRADGRDAVLSRRALLEEEKAERAKATRAALAEGASFDGTVTSVQDYGAFVDIGGIEGLVHVSELAWDRVSKPQDVLKQGDQVKVQVLRIDQDAKKGERISLSVRALVEKPVVPEAAPVEGAAPGEKKARPVPPPPPKVGDVVKASVDKIEPFGIFVRFPGGRGLVPASETGTPRGADLRKAFKAGDELTCAIVAIDDQHRIRLSLTAAEQAAERKEAAEYMAKSPRPSGRGFGTLGDLLREKLKK